MITDESGVKFFDRKFVASNLHSQLRCPKCNSEYSHKHTKVGAEDNKRPFLLPCGHNMCEYCISKHRQKNDFKCAVCCTLAQPTIAAKDPNHKYVGNIRDYYELNYHVLGETNSLDYYRRYSVESVNSSLKCSGDNTTEIVMETKCSECNHISANGECKQCCAFYCRRCFEIVHYHSRVLRSHVLQRLADNKRPEKGIRVGKDIFRMPDRTPCNVHNMPKSIFCYNCKRNHCKGCSMIYHANHKICSVFELNFQYVTEVPATIQSLENGLFHINNAQQLVKNSKKKLGDFAAETLAKISSSYRFLHGQLQNAELQTIEMLRESSLPSQMQLNVAMSQLNGYETILNNLRQMLYSSINDRIGTQQDIRLQEVICLANEHLEKIPTQAHVTKFNENPYHFNCSMDSLSAIIVNYFVCEFNDPKIEVHFNNEVDRQSVISCGVNSTTHNMYNGNNWHDQRLSQNQQQTSSRATSSGRSKKSKRYNNNRSLNSSNSSMNTSHDDYHRLAQQRKLLRAIPETDSRGANANEQQNAFSPHIGDWFRTGAIVHVRAIESPEDFYVQCFNAAQRFREQLSAFVNTLACKQPQVIVVGQQYITYNNKSEIDRWHRALVSQKAEQRDIYHVFLPDIGVNNQVHISDFRELPKHLASLPYAAVHCSLKQLMPPEGYDWEPIAGDFLKQLVQNNIELAVMRSLGPQFYEVDLMLNYNGSKISVRESFLYTGLARASESYATALTPRPQQLIALPSQRLPQYVPQVGDILMVQVLHVQHPQDFYAMPSRMEKTRIDLQQQLQSYMERLNLAQLKPIYLGCLHLGCVLKWEGEWHRACIVDMLPKGSVVVRLVDSGVTQRIYWDELFMLPAQFWGQELAIKCRLADVETLQQNGYAWTTAAINEFKQISSNPKLQLEVIYVRDMVAHVSLHYSRSAGGESINVAAKLVAQNHCYSSGESSKVRQPPPPRHSQLDADTRKLIEQSKLQLSEHSSSDKTNSKLTRSAIEVVHVENPNEFYVTMAHFAPAIAELRQMVQVNASNMYGKVSPRSDWQPGEMCYVRAIAKTDSQKMWHRGQIVDKINDDSLTYNVRLRDIGELIVGVPPKSLTNMDDHLLRVTNSAVRCELFGIVPNDEKWSPKAIDFFKESLLAYSSLSVTGHGRKGDSFFVTLWGVRTVISGPFSPDVYKYTSINDVLVEAGFAENFSGYEIQLLEMNAKSTESDNSKEWNSDCEEIIRAVDKINQISEIEGMATNTMPNTDFQHSDEMPPLDLLREFNTGARTTGYAEAPPAWLRPRQCNKSVFTAIPTNVNYFCEVYLTLSSDDEFMKHMSTLLVEHFTPIMEKEKATTYVVGQPVVVIYHLDKLFYRGIVKSDVNSEGEHKVYYVDFGNMENVLRSDMLPYAPFPHLNAMCWPVMIHGVKRKKYSTSAMDFVHSRLVMKLCNVRVVGAKNKSDLPTCQIKVNGVDITELMMANNIVEPLQQYAEQLEKENKRNQALKSFKIFDELLQLGKMRPKQPQVLAVNEIALECCDVDFDCREAVKQQKQTYVDFEKSSSDDGDDKSKRNVKAQLNGFSDDYLFKELNEDFSNGDDDDNNSESPKPDQVSLMAPHVMSAMDQLLYRAELRHKKNFDSAHFLPMDTSTVRSYGDGIDVFKPQCLPTGVNSFPCVIDKIVSATELQVTPQITEFAKQGIVLAQETSALIRDASQLVTVKLEALCLARCALDNQWYRAVIKELHHNTQQATVYYIDFHDTETVSCIDLKEMPKQLYMFPLRSFRVKLHNIKLNKQHYEQHVRFSLVATLKRHPTVFARVHFTEHYHDNLLEVDIYKDKNETELIYQPLIDCQMYLLKKH